MYEITVVDTSSSPAVKKRVRVRDQRSDASWSSGDKVHLEEEVCCGLVHGPVVQGC